MTAVEHDDFTEFLKVVLLSLRERAAEQARDGPDGETANLIALTAYGWLGDNIASFVTDIDVGAKITAAMAPSENAAQGSGEPGADWRDDPSADQRWNAGVDFAQQKLCKVLGVNPVEVDWDVATETLDGDVEAVIGNILTLSMGERWRSDPSDHLDSYDAVFAAHRESEVSRFVIACLRKTTNGRLPHALLVDYLRRAFLGPTSEEIATTFERMEADGLVSMSLPVVDLTEKGARS